MYRVLLICAVIFLLLRLIYRMFSGRIRSVAGMRDRQPTKMVKCACCELYLAQADAIRGPDDNYYCSREHRESAIINKDR